tara:strand:+ start:150 stop:554 length:405 start_codon:yes stop_codon:yes gene_type:complete
MVSSKDPFGINNFEKKLLEKSSKKIRREAIPMIWRDKILVKQKNLCVGKDCENLHNGKKLLVNNRSDFDHKKPLALGGKHLLSNLQALCPGCHRLKTREDRYKISQQKKKIPKKKIKKSSNSFEIDLNKFDMNF